MQQRYFEDFRVGDRFETPGTTLTEAQIVDFALTYDPQPFHRDKVAAGHSLYGGLIASGFQTMALAFRLFIDTGVLGTSNLGGGAGEMRWLRPVRPGDTLRVVVEVASIEPSKSRNDRGRIRFAYTGLNQDGEPVLTMMLDHIVARRHPEVLEA